MFYPSSSKNPEAHTGVSGALIRLLAAVVLCSAAPTWALRSDANQPIHINGDDAEIDQQNGTIVYTGSVQVAQGTLRVNGDKMVVEISGDQVRRISTTGSPARYQQELEDDQGSIIANADAIVYHTAAERVYLKGKATLIQKGNEMHGESIRYNIVTGKIDANAGEGRVTMTLDPSTQPATSEKSD